MASIAQRCLKILRWFAEGSATYPLAIAMPANGVLDHASPPELVRHSGYFSVRLNQLALARGRSWWVSVSPMAFVVTEFQYGTERISVPFVVGPSMLEQYGQPVPNGMLFEDTLVAGPHPYIGGRISITTILYQVPRTSEAKRLLSLVESAGGAFGAATALGAYLKMATVLLDGVEALLSIDGVRPVAGRRHEVNPDLDDTLGSGYFALMDPAVSAASLRVQGRRLLQDSRSGLQEPAGVDFLLYSLGTTTRRTDLDQLSFARNLREAEKVAATEGSDDGWKRAKGLMSAAFSEIIDSPDLTREHGDALREEYRARLLVLKVEAQRNNDMAAGDEDPQRAAALVDAASVLDL